MRGHAGAAHESPGLLSHEARTLISVTLQHGSERVDVPYLWPSTLALPERPPKLIYLDLNHWIELANALCGSSGLRQPHRTAGCAQRRCEQRRCCVPAVGHDLLRSLQDGKPRSAPGTARGDGAAVAVPGRRVGSSTSRHTKSKPCWTSSSARARCRSTRCHTWTGVWLADSAALAASVSETVTTTETSSTTCAPAGPAAPRRSTCSSWPALSLA